jgi:hypothetical protein
MYILSLKYWLKPVKQNMSQGLKLEEEQNIISQRHSYKCG